MHEPDTRTDRLARAVIGASIEVHRQLGSGLLEGVYERALAFELNDRGIPFEVQVPVTLQYKGRPLGQGRLDLLVDGRLIVELKAVESLTRAHTAQVLSYLISTGAQLGLLINFNAPLLKQGIRRVVLTSRNSDL